MTEYECKNCKNEKTCPSKKGSHKYCFEPQAEKECNEMEWNVYCYNINKNQIEKFNIFHHHGFVKYYSEYLKTSPNKETFAEAIRKELSYYFRCKSEYELIIKRAENNRVFLYPWIGGRDPETEKIEVTSDANFDWLSFAKEHINKQIYKNEAKIDVYNQVIFEFDKFIDYVWKSNHDLLNQDFEPRKKGGMNNDRTREID